jgi:hypothetical protein
MCVLGACVLVFLVPPKVAQATFPGTNGNIAYDHPGSDGTDWEIYTINATGGTPFKVTDNTTDDGSPSWGRWSAAPPSAPPED